MNPKLQIASLIIGIIFFLFIIYTLRKKRLSSSYSIIWLILSIFLISIPIFESFYIYISRSLFGIYTENIIYIILIGYLSVNILYLTVKVVRLNDQVKELISFTAILENKLQQKNLK